MNRGVAASGSLLASSGGQPVTRDEVVAMARSYAEHRWWAVGPDDERASEENVGLPYKWGGFDSLASFDAGLRDGKAAGDLYSSAKRYSGEDAVNDDAVGLDCSGFISRCWKLPHKLGTARLPGVCVPLGSTDELQPGDVMNQPRGHVLLFAHWIDPSRSGARFYEAEPRSKVMMSEYSIWGLRLRGAKPLRYQRIRD
jgi:hypothetical protein